MARHPSALVHTNRSGVKYFLHRGTTKTGKPRYYVAREVGAGALATLPDGYEIVESINGVVSVARAGRSKVLVPAADVSIVRAEVARHRHLRHHTVEARGAEILVHQATNRLDDETIRTHALMTWDDPERLAARLALVQGPPRYEPVMKFTMRDRGAYGASRITYRERTEWLPFATGPLAWLAKRYIRKLGTDDFYELW